ncbi:GA module-containing protein [Mycoplasmopsis verecunda]|uniref:Uncharacterized Sugar-binding Domain n=1 Tax=Mycoplasmopsis verecunda TaxID=171291 RepID=A0A1T4L4E7_9BACT|nr:GA module-containing protein [Mycoplasmopsis verecunda]WPB54435.1 GA module-containing protein [Mycoplasmopsis verecunda]SJZ49488.1 Uncharacterised Sugar-binding Domain [Mycoplasmopsis verecunda]
MKKKIIIPLASTLGAATASLTVLSASPEVEANNTDQNVSAVNYTEQNINDLIQQYTFQYGIGGLRNDQINKFKEKLQAVKEQQSALNDLHKEITDTYNLMVKWYNALWVNSLGDPKYYLNATDKSGAQNMYAPGPWGQHNTDENNKNTMYYHAYKAFETNFWPEATVEATESNFQKAVLELKDFFISKMGGYADVINLLWNINSDYSTDSTEIDTIYHTTSGPVVEYLLAAIGIQGNVGGATAQNNFDPTNQKAFINGTNSYKKIFKKINTELGGFNEEKYTQSNFYNNLKTQDEINTLKNIIQSYIDFIEKTSNVKNLDFGDYRLTNGTGKINWLMVLLFGNGQVPSSNGTASIGTKWPGIETQFTQLEAQGLENYNNIKQQLADSPFSALPQEAVASDKAYGASLPNYNNVNAVYLKAVALNDIYTPLVEQYKKLSSVMSSTAYTSASTETQEAYKATWEKLNKYLDTTNQEAPVAKGITYNNEQPGNFTIAPDLNITSQQVTEINSNLDTAYANLNGLQNEAIKQLKVITKPSALTQEQIQSFQNQINEIKNDVDTQTKLGVILKKAQLQADVNWAQEQVTQAVNTELVGRLNNYIQTAQNTIASTSITDPNDESLNSETFIQHINAEITENNAIRDKFTGALAKMNNLPADVVSEIVETAKGITNGNDFNNYVRTASQLNNAVTFASEIAANVQQGNIPVSAQQQEALQKLVNTTFNNAFENASLAKASDLANLMNNYSDEKNNEEFNQLKTIGSNSIDDYIKEANTPATVELLNTLKSQLAEVNGTQNVENVANILAQAKAISYTDWLQYTKNSIQELNKAGLGDGIDTTSFLQNVDNLLNTAQGAEGDFALLGAMNKEELVKEFDKIIDQYKTATANKITSTLSQPLVAKTGQELAKPIASQDSKTFITGYSNTLANANAIETNEQLLQKYLNRFDFTADSKTSTTTELIKEAYTVSTPEAQNAFMEVYKQVKAFFDNSDQVVTADAIKEQINKLQDAYNNLDGKALILETNKDLKALPTTTELRDNLQEEVYSAQSREALLATQAKIKSLQTLSNNVATALLKDNDNRNTNEELESIVNQNNTEKTIVTSDELTQIQQLEKSSPIYQNVVAKYNALMDDVKAVGTIDKDKMQFVISSQEPQATAKIQNLAQDLNNLLNEVTQQVSDAWNIDKSSYETLKSYVGDNKEQSVVEAMQKLQNESNDLGNNISATQLLSQVKFQNDLINTTKDSFKTIQGSQNPALSSDVIATIANKFTLSPNNLNDLKSQADQLNTSASQLNDSMQGAQAVLKDPAYANLSQDLKDKLTQALNNVTPLYTDNKLNDATKTPEELNELNKALSDALANVNQAILNNAKANALEEINKLANLTDSQKQAAIAKVNEASDVANVTQALNSANDLNTAVGSLKQALETVKNTPESINYQFADKDLQTAFDTALTNANDAVNDQYNGLDAQQVNALAQALTKANSDLNGNDNYAKQFADAKAKALESIKNNAALTEPQKQLLNQEVNDATTLEQIAAAVTHANNYADANNALNEAISNALGAQKGETYKDSTAQSQQALNDLLQADQALVKNGLSGKSVDEINALAEALNNQIRSLDGYQIQQAKANAIDTINALQNITPEQKAQYIQQVNDAKDLPSIAQVVSNASDLDKAIKGLKEKLASVANVSQTPNYLDATKELQDEFNNAITAGQNALKDLNSLSASDITKLTNNIDTANNALNGDERNAQALANAKTRAIASVNNLSYLTPQQKANFIDQINNAKVLDQLQPILDVASNTNNAMDELIKAMDQANEAKNTDNFKYASLSNQKDLVMQLTSDETQMTQGMEELSPSDITTLANNLTKAIAQLNGEQNIKDGKASNLKYWIALTILGALIFLGGIGLYGAARLKKKSDK